MLNAILLYGKCHAFGLLHLQAFGLANVSAQNNLIVYTNDIFSDILPYCSLFTQM